MLSIGGISADRGWLRILGSGHPDIGDGLVRWNESLGGVALNPPLRDGLVIAYDAIGGFFTVDLDATANTLGSVRYRSTEDTGPFDLGMGYTQFLRFSLSAAVDQFYAANRWTGWEDDLRALGPDQAFMIYPPIGFDGPPLPDRHRGVVPARELWTYVASLAAIPEGGQVNVEVR